MNALRRFLANDDAATAVEYAVMLALILMVLITAIRSFGNGTGSMWRTNGNRLNEVGFDS